MPGVGYLCMRCWSESPQSLTKKKKYMGSFQSSCPLPELYTKTPLLKTVHISDVGQQNQSGTGQKSSKRCHVTGAEEKLLSS